MSQTSYRTALPRCNSRPPFGWPRASYVSGAESHGPCVVPVFTFTPNSLLPASGRIAVSDANPTFLYWSLPLEPSSVACDSDRPSASRGYKTRQRTACAFLQNSSSLPALAYNSYHPGPVAVISGLTGHRSMGLSFSGSLPMDYCSANLPVLRPRLFTVWCSFAAAVRYCCVNYFPALRKSLRARCKFVVVAGLDTCSLEFGFALDPPVSIQGMTPSLH